MLIDSLLNPQNDYADEPPGDLSSEILRDLLLRALLEAHLAQREIMPRERLPVVPKRGLRLNTDVRTLRHLASWLNSNIQAPVGPDAIGRYGALLVYAITLWRAWRRKHLPCSPGFTLLAPHALFKHQDLEVVDPKIPEWRRSFRVRLAPAGCRPLRARWESAPAKAYREPITHAEVLDGLSFIVENELLPLTWAHVLPWAAPGDDAHPPRPLSARAATERRAPRLWLFPLDHGKLQFEPFDPQDGRPWTGSFAMKIPDPMNSDDRSKLDAELLKIARLVAANQEPGQSRDVLVFPELCLDAQGVDALRRTLHAAGANPALVIAGSHHAPLAKDDRLVRAQAPIFAEGEDQPLWLHQKRGPFRVTGEEWMKWYPDKRPALKDDDELWEHIKPGDTFTTFDGPGGRVGVLICADLLEERFPAMRDLVRISLVDLLVVVNLSPKTTLFMRHAEQLNRLGICVVFLNATIAVHSADPKNKTDIEPFTALVALPQLTVPSALKIQLSPDEQEAAKTQEHATEQERDQATWIIWRSTDHKLMLQTKNRGWKALSPESLPQKIREFRVTEDSPAALLVDLNAWLADPTNVLINDDPVMIALEPAIRAALTGKANPREARVATLQAAEETALPRIAEGMPDKTRALLQEIGGLKRALFEPTRAEHSENLKTLFAQRLARPHRLAVPPKEGNSQGANAESSFIVSLTPLGEALVTLLPPAPRSTRLGA